MRVTNVGTFLGLVLLMQHIFEAVDEKENTRSGLAGGLATGVLVLVGRGFGFFFFGSEFPIRNQRRLPLCPSLILATVRCLYLGRHFNSLHQPTRHWSVWDCARLR